MAPSSDLENRVRARVGTTLIGKYRLDAVLGIGGIAAVFAATHRNSKRVAVKILHGEWTDNLSIRSHFLREGYAANSVGHPGAVKVDDDDVTEDGTVFIVMELLQGIVVEELRERFGGRLTVHASVAIVDGLLEVLAAAHSRNIVHRDVKPPNLFLIRDGSLKVLDFGIARIRDAATQFGTGSMTGTGDSLGTPGFMAPEQAIGESKAVDARTDIWAASATLFKLITGELVHEARSAQELRVCAARDQARRLEVVDPGVPVAIARVVNRGLAHDKEGRWRTAAEMRQALRSAYLQVYGRLPQPVSDCEWEPPPKPLGVVEATGAVEQVSTKPSVKPIVSDLGPKPANGKWRAMPLIAAGVLGSVAFGMVRWGFGPNSPTSLPPLLGSSKAAVLRPPPVPVPGEEEPAAVNATTPPAPVDVTPPRKPHSGVLSAPSVGVRLHDCDPPTYMDLDAGIKRPKPWCI